MNDLFKEKAYKILSEKYKRLYTTISTRARNALEFGEKEDAVKVLRTIVEEGEDVMTGIISKTDKEVIKLLEYLLDNEEPVK
jgi:hypothetical protein